MTVVEDRVLALPTTADLRWWWVQGVAEGVSEKSAEEQFDRWLAGIRGVPVTRERLAAVFTERFPYLDYEAEDVADAILAAFDVRESTDG